MTNEEIIEKAERLARLFYELDGFTVPEWFTFRDATAPRAKETWARVVLAFDELLQTPLRDVVEELEE
jgi:hypothetical protein